MRRVNPPCFCGVDFVVLQMSLPRSGLLTYAENGDEVIENIQVGDYVWAHNPETGETALKRVAQTFRNETTELVTVTAGDDVIEATPEHPFYVPGCDEPRANSTGLGKGWVKAKDLRQGDVLVLFDGSTVIVDSVSISTLDSSITVYNFEVEDFHTCFVGNEGLLVHNVCLPSSYGGSAAYKHADLNDSHHSFPRVVDNFAHINYRERI